MRIKHKWVARIQGLETWWYVKPGVQLRVLNSPIIRSNIEIKIQEALLNNHLSWNDDIWQERDYFWQKHLLAEFLRITYNQDV
jgi:hypothetical protein